ncbi:hypothetical protein RclHR1_01800020 [Rhizophagus clarus]|uniref:Uncharacterized protein n=1 Tax=Rhizophagus clarus TaxID=94130 RepID=A0A2Z6QMZ7_9GLOM|nr:hypothetical protein RclHR1_01800020 [Rhizophagus clarus]GES89127.1 hypothetical protein GLOIN_2v1838284 [Rhizophagus clarus]
MERKQRIKELLKRKLPEKENMTNKKPNAMKTATVATIITNSTNEKMVIRESTATTNTMNKQNKTTTESCIVCGKNLSYCSLNTRESHINTCLDNKIETETNFISFKKFDAKQRENNEHSLFAIAMVCPCCNMPFKAKTEKGKLNHFRTCGRKRKYTPNKMLEFLQELKRKYGRDPPSYLSSSMLSKPGKTSSHTGPKEKKLTSYFNPISNDKDKLSKTDSISQENPKLSYVVSRSYNVSILDHDDDDFQSSIVFKARSTVEKSDKRKKEIDDDDDFQVGVALSRSILPSERFSQKRKKVKYDLNTTPILSCADAIKKAKERAKIMFFNRPTINEIAKNLASVPKFPKSKVGEKYARQNYNEIEGRPNRKRHPYTLWEVQAFGGNDNPLSRDDYITDMIWHYMKNLDDKKTIDELKIEIM